MTKTLAGNLKGKKNRPKAKLGIPDLEHSKDAVLRSLGSSDSRRILMVPGARPRSSRWNL